MEQNRFEVEVDRNYDVFEQLLPGLLATRRGEVALMRGGQVLDFFGSEAVALREGRARYPDGLFSVQEITDRPADLGFFSHAINTRLA